MNGEVVNAISMAFTKARIERVLGAGLGHRQTYPAGEPVPTSGLVSLFRHPTTGTLDRL